MLYFENDYCEGAHPAILQKLTEKIKQLRSEIEKQSSRTMTNVLTAFSCQRTFVIFYLLNSDITGGVVHNYAFSCIHRHIGCR